MITIRRVSMAEKIDEMSEHFVLSGWEDRGAFSTQIKTHLSHDSNQLFVVEARDEQGGLLGFVIANNPKAPFVWILQAWSKAGNPPKILDELILRVHLWTVGLGKSVIRAETQRNIEPFIARTGMKVVSTIVEHEISPEFFTNMMGHLKEHIHGRNASA